PILPIGKRPLSAFPVIQTILAARWSNRASSLRRVYPNLGNWSIQIGLATRPSILVENVAWIGLSNQRSLAKQAGIALRAHHFRVPWTRKPALSFVQATPRMSGGIERPPGAGGYCGGRFSETRRSRFS